MTSTLTLLGTVAENGGFDWRAFLAPFHSVMLHFPIGFVTLACLLDLYHLRNPHPEIRKLSTRLMILCALSALVVAGLGLLRASGGGYEPASLGAHRFWGLSVAVIISGTLIAQRLALRQSANKLTQRTYRALLFSSLGVLVVTGHLGGNLTYGAGYLVRNAPEFVKNIFDGSHASSNSTALTENDARDPGARLFLDTIQPIFQAKCHACHGPEKQKGKYRLDQKEIALKGGDSEETAIVPGDAMASFLTHLIMLPDDDDEVMPPEGKERLTPEEIIAIVRWIQQGAPFADEYIASTNASL